MRPPRSIAHVVFGPTAAGKSTYARALVTEVGGVRFAIDEWMQALFGPDAPVPLQMGWVMPRVGRCQAQAFSVARQILGAGTQVVLEMGLLRKADRDAVRAAIEQAGHAARFHFVDADADLRRQRVRERNQTQGDTYAFEVTPAMFEMIESIFERPDDAELATCTRVPAAAR